MNDRELLEMAAKAAGMGELVFHSEEERYAVVITPLGGRANTWHFWNPLEDDDDALRLAVKLEMQLNLRHSENVVRAYGAPTGAIDEGVHGGDPYAATRRAVTRAAAEIGRSME